MFFFCARTSLAKYVCVFVCANFVHDIRANLRGYIYYMYLHTSVYTFRAARSIIESCCKYMRGGVAICAHNTRNIFSHLFLAVACGL